MTQPITFPGPFLYLCLGPDSNAVRARVVSYLDTVPDDDELRNLYAEIYFRARTWRYTQFLNNLPPHEYLPEDSAYHPTYQGLLQHVDRQQQLVDDILERMRRDEGDEGLVSESDSEHLEEPNIAETEQVEPVLDNNEQLKGESVADITTSTSAEETSEGTQSVTPYDRSGEPGVIDTAIITLQEVQKTL